jgi:hypothetical protein
MSILPKCNSSRIFATMKNQALISARVQQKSTFAMAFC